MKGFGSLLLSFWVGFSLSGSVLYCLDLPPLFFFGTDVSGSIRESSFVFLLCPDSSGVLGFVRFF